MNIQQGDRFYHGRFKDYATVVKYVNHDNWYYTLDSQPSKVYNTTRSPNNFKWTWCESVDGSEESGE